MDQGSNKNHSPAYNFTPTVTKFCVMWEGLSLPHDTKFGNCRCKIVDSRSFHSWSLIHGLRWSGLIKVGPGAVTRLFRGRDTALKDMGKCSARTADITLTKKKYNKNCALRAGYIVLCIEVINSPPLVISKTIEPAVRHMIAVQIVHHI